MNQHFRGVVWPKEPRTEVTVSAQGSEVRTNYQYVIVGCLITDEPIEGLEGPEIDLDGHPVMLAQILPMIERKPAAIKIGDANSVLLNLSRIVESE